MDYAEIKKNKKSNVTSPNLENLHKASEDWSWDNVENELNIPKGKFNQAYVCIDKHAEANPDKLAIIWQSAEDKIENYTFSDFRDESNKFANAMNELGLQKSDRVFFFTDRIPELYFACSSFPFTC